MEGTPQEMHDLLKESKDQAPSDVDNEWQNHHRCWCFLEKDREEAKADVRGKNAILAKIKRFIDNPKAAKLAEARDAAKREEQQEAEKVAAEEKLAAEAE